jgi:hypothetical protein
MDIVINILSSKTTRKLFTSFPLILPDILEYVLHSVTIKMYFHRVMNKNSSAAERSSSRISELVIFHNE